MSDVCFRCGEHGHLSYDCPTHTRGQAAPAAPARATPAGADEPTYPELNWQCPTCNAPPGLYCANIAHGFRMKNAEGGPVTHPARTEVIWQDPAMRERLAQLRGVAQAIVDAEERARAGAARAREITGYRPEDFDRERRAMAARQAAESRAERHQELDAPASRAAARAQASEGLADAQG